MLRCVICTATSFAPHCILRIVCDRFVNPPINAQNWKSSRKQKGKETIHFALEYRPKSAFTLKTTVFDTNKYQKWTLKSNEFNSIPLQIRMEMVSENRNYPICTLLAWIQINQFLSHCIPLIDEWDLYRQRYCAQKFVVHYILRLFELFIYPVILYPNVNRKRFEFLFYFALSLCLWFAFCCDAIYR